MTRREERVEREVVADGGPVADDAEVYRWANDIHQGDVLETLREMPESSVHTVVTSPPYYGLRDYGVEEQIGLEDTLDEYVATIVEVAEELRRVLRADGSWWLNLGDTYAGSQNGRSMEGDTKESQPPEGRPAPGADIDEVLDEAEDIGIERSKAEHTLEKIKRRGEAYEPKTDKEVRTSS